MTGVVSLVEPHSRLGGKFRLRKRLAVGGMGEVWMARNESTGADVALKVLRRGELDGGTAEEMQVEERFRHEAHVSAMLSHRSIVKVFDLVDLDDGTIILVMELLRGETLHEYIERAGPRPTREAVAILTPILSALAHAHELGIVHRDVTPPNIFLAVDPDGHVTPKLVDFGIAKLATGATPRPSQPISVQTLDGRVLGTPSYMAPERIRAGDVDGRADIFAAAVVLYETMTAVSPFAASNPSATLAAVLERQIDPDPRIDPRVWVEIRRALSKQPSGRHATAYEFALALRSAIGETEGGLDACLYREPPPTTWDDEHQPQRIPSTRPHTQSIHGQSVSIRPRRRSSVWGWIATGLMAGALMGAAVYGLRMMGEDESTTGATAPQTTIGSGVEMPAVPPPPVETASPVTASPNPVASPRVGPVAQPSASARPRFIAPPRPKPIATTPGF